MTVNYPFPAIVGQDDLRTALLACSVSPSIGGVLIRGDKGTAKTTAARAFADVLPPISKVKGCVYNCNDVPIGSFAQSSDDAEIAIYVDSPVTEDEQSAAGAINCSPCSTSDRHVYLVQPPFVNMPLAATEDRVIGSLDFEQALKSGTKAFQPGLLASAHRGILYIDEVNLLADHLADVLLDVAASGINRIEREGMAVWHPSSFLLIGTMNPEEGDLRPQLLDRFAMVVDVRAPEDASLRSEVVRRRLLFEANPASYVQEWRNEIVRLQQAVSAARTLLPSVILSNEQQLAISKMCVSLQIRSLRADIVINKLCRTLAALDGRTFVIPEDIKRAAALALPHRMRNKPGERSRMDQNQLQQTLENLDEELQPPTTPPESPGNQDNAQQPKPESQPDSGESSNQAEDFDSGDDSFAPDAEGDDEQSSASRPPMFVKPESDVVARHIQVDASEAFSSAGRRSTSSQSNRGVYVRADKAESRSSSAVAIDATIKHSVLRNNGALVVKKDDLHFKKNKSKTANFVLFVVDASGSMAARRRMEAVKGAVLALLDDAYQSRDTVGLIAFREQESNLVMPPTRSTDLARELMVELPVGGTTPLAHALRLAKQTIERHSKEQSSPLLVLLTDGKGNVPLAPQGDAWADSLAAAEELAASQVTALVIDTEGGFVRLGRAQLVAQSLGADCVTLEDITADSVKLAVKGKLGGRKL